jgi:hypothetical protein
MALTFATAPGLTIATGVKIAIAPAMRSAAVWLPKAQKASKTEAFQAS